MFDKKKILIVSAHPDDIEFGLGATLNQLDKKNIKIVIFSDTTNVNGQGIVDEINNSMKIYKLPFTLLKFENMNFTNQQKEIRQKLYDIKQEYSPDIVFSTNRSSFNPDHSVLGEACMAVFQEQTVLFYEVVRGDYEHTPNFYNEVDDEDADVKVKALSQYNTQIAKRDYIKSQQILAHVVYRGSQCGRNAAEAFEVGRIVL